MRIRSSGMQSCLAISRISSTFESLQLALLVDELLRRQGRVDRHLQLAGRNQVAVRDGRLAALRRGREDSDAEREKHSGDQWNTHDIHPR